MSNNAKTQLINFSDSLKIMKVVVDCAQSGLTVGCHSINSYLPANHDVLNVDYRVNTVGASSGSATVSFGFDDIATEPDNLLNDEAIASFSSDAQVSGIPRMGTAATKVSVGTSDAQLAYEVKVADLTALKFTAIIVLLPTK